MDRFIAMLVALLLSGMSNGGMDAVPNNPSGEITISAHSEFYIPDVDVEDVITYFAEVCLDSEITHSGNPNVVQKWGCPIEYEIHGSPTAEDIRVIEEFSAWLNTVEGFPGISESPYTARTNMKIYFCPQSEIPERMGDDFTNMDGAVTYWYEANQIYDCIICVRSDADQHLRTSVILEEIYNSLGAVQDTVLRPDSLIYQYYAEPQELTEIDELIVRLLYHPDIKYGMNAERCAQVIRRLYY